jgi:hypothetical protein
MQRCIQAVCLLVAALMSGSSLAQSRFVTLTVDGITQTNQQFTIQNNETAKLKWAFDSSGSFSLNVSRAGSSLSLGENQLQGNTMDSYHDFYQPPNLVVVAGPATLTLISNYNPAGHGNVNNTAMATFEIVPETFPPNQTLIVPPGTNQVAITLETSTNLATWSTATNGIYGAPDAVRFFRIRMDKQN